MSDLEPPRKSVELEDPGAHELESSESDEHFSDASEGRPASPVSKSHSPVPLTRVERVDDQPSYGEVPGTEAYKKRTQDAVPDEVEIVPDGQRSRSNSRLRIEDIPVSPGGTPVPKTVVEVVDTDRPLHGEVPGTEAFRHRMADAEPDIVIKVPQPPQKDTEKEAQGSPTSSIYRSPTSVIDFPPPMTLESPTTEPSTVEVGGLADELKAEPKRDQGGGDNAEFGDDFDDFEEGGAGDDFGDFDDGFGDGDEIAEPAFEYPHRPSVSFSAPDPVSEALFDSKHECCLRFFPISPVTKKKKMTDNALTNLPTPKQPTLDFSGLTSLEDITTATESHIRQLFPPPPKTSAETMDSDSVLSSERSASLWSQLVAPPPLQPPDWVRSRIRRLFLVSLGVPVDLDEILPASKQKKLILPSISISTSPSPDPFPADTASATFLSPSSVRRGDPNASTTSLDTASNISPRSDIKRRGPLPPPELDISSTTMLCKTTDAALQNFTDEELKAHVERLKELRSRADEVLEYWKKRIESAIGDKEAFEGVIENLVMHAKKTRN